MVPFISVIIPMRNEQGWIDRSLDAVLAQDYPASRYEVIIVDGMSDDGSFERVSRFADEDARVRVLKNPGRIVPTGLNLGIEAARGDVIARVDAHTTIAPDYLSRGIEALERSGADGVGGPMTSIGGGPIGDAIARAMASRFGIGATFHFARKECEVDTVYMGMWPRTVFDRVGLFDEELVRDQDDEMSYRIRKHGGRLVISPRMRSEYQNRQSWRRLARQFYQYGYWKVRVLQKHPAQMGVRHFVPPFFDGAVLVGALAWPILPAWTATAATGIGGYGLVTLAVAMIEGQGLAGRLRLALAFAIIHHAWAMGFLTGLVRFAGSWLREESPTRRLARGETAETERR